MEAEHLPDSGSLQDDFGRTIDYMRISITDRCNLRCSYCMPQGIRRISMKDILTFEEIEEICAAAAAAGIKKLKLTGGEPLVRKGCAELIGKLTKIPGIEQVTMTTNGILLGDYLDKLIENGLHAVNISLDSRDEDIYERITGQRKLNNVLENIKKSLGKGLKVKINCVLLRDVNDSEWVDLIEFAREQPLDVRFIEMMPIGYGRQYQPVPNEELLEKMTIRYGQATVESASHGNGPAVYYKFPGLAGSVGFISAIHGKFCGSCNRIRLTSMGQIKPCLCYGETIDLKPFLANASRTQRKELLTAAIGKAVKMKPQAHCFEQQVKITESKQMVQIGG